jgi:hypothetical protein
MNDGVTTVDDVFRRRFVTNPRAIFVKSRKGELVLVENGNRFIVNGPREVFFESSDSRMVVLGALAVLPTECAFDGTKMTNGTLVVRSDRDYSVLNWWRLDRHSAELALRLVHNVLVAATRSVKFGAILKAFASVSFRSAVPVKCQYLSLPIISKFFVCRSRVRCA